MLSVNYTSIKLGKKFFLIETQAQVLIMAFSGSTEEPLKPIVSGLGPEPESCQLHRWFVCAGSVANQFCRIWPHFPPLSHSRPLGCLLVPVPGRYTLHCFCICRFTPGSAITAAVFVQTKGTYLTNLCVLSLLLFISILPPCFICLYSNCHYPIYLLIFNCISCPIPLH